jgi:hypothetical protein
VPTFKLSGWDTRVEHFVEFGRRPPLSFWQAEIRNYCTYKHPSGKDQIGLGREIGPVIGVNRGGMKPRYMQRVCKTYSSASAIYGRTKVTTRLKMKILMKVKAPDLFRSVAVGISDEMMYVNGPNPAA